MLPGAADVNRAMCADPNIAMSPSPVPPRPGGVGELAGKHLKKVTLELGGKNRLIILDVPMSISPHRAAGAPTCTRGRSA